MVTDIHAVENGTCVTSDICIIGSGAAGITLAREFLNCQATVTVLEAGGKVFEASSQDPYKSEVIGLPHGGIHHGRVRQLGGSTTLWAGQALPFFPIDFEKREWIPYSGWPITREELLPFYYRAEEVMQIPHVKNDENGWPVGKLPPPPYTPGSVVNYFSQFTTTPNFVQKYGELIATAKNVSLLTHGNVTSLEANATATALDKVIVRALDGHSIHVKARFFVVCCGGIESARLLLLSDSVESHGIGNRYDVVGRYFQDHPGVGVPVRPIAGSSFHEFYDSYRLKGIRHSIKVVASDELQRSEAITHIGGEIYYPPNEEDSIVAAKELLKIARHPHRLSELPSAMGKVIRNPSRVITAAYRHYVRKMPPSVASTEPMLGFGGEQEPNPESRITLSSDVDALSKRRTVLNWRMTRNDVRSMEVYLRVLAAEWRRLGIAILEADRVELAGRETGASGGFVDANHHMGTTRMGENPRYSVVDSHCRVHGYGNLYIGSASVFPTGSFSNPTLTVLALSLRIADELKQQLE